MSHLACRQAVVTARPPQQGGRRTCEEPRASGVQVWQEQHLGLEALHDALEG